MWATDLSRHRSSAGAAWVVFAVVNLALTFTLPGRETIPYHLLWASFALMYGLFRWPKVLSRSVFATIAVVTGIALVKHAASDIIEWEECSEIVLMSVILALLVWHIDRHWMTEDRLIAAQEAERRQAVQRDLASRFGSHEVRTRLAIARSYAEIIADGDAHPEARADARVIIHELDQASAIATNILTLVRVVNPPRPETMDADQLIGAVLRRWSVAAQRNWALHTEVGIIQGDPERIETLLDCLLENAVKFTGVGDEIRVSADLLDSVVQIVVDDEGDGIPPRDVAGIFDLFATGSDVGARAGNGIGLPIVKAIVDARGGTVDVVSLLGVGTRFTVRLPLIPPGEPDAVRHAVESGSLLDRA